MKQPPEFAQSGDQQPGRTPQILPPETITDDQLATLGPVFIPKFINDYLADYKRLCAAGKDADRESLLQHRHDFKNLECWVAAWRERIDTFAQKSPNNWNVPAAQRFAELENAIRAAGDDVLAALNGELPGQGADDGEEWKHAE
jgi:hypothetical protein